MFLSAGGLPFWNRFITDPSIPPNPGGDGTSRLYELARPRDVFRFRGGQKIVPLTSGALYRTFGAVTHPSDPEVVDLSQGAEAISISGDVLQGIPRDAQQFRSLVPNGGWAPGAPLVEAKLGSGEAVWPLGALTHGAGYLVCAGLVLEKARLHVLRAICKATLVFVGSLRIS